MKLKNCKSFNDMCERIGDSTDDQIFSLWKSGELRKKTAELNCSNKLTALDEINLNTSKNEIIKQLKAIYTKEGCGCVVLLFVISIPLSIAVGYTLFTSIIV